MQAIVYGWSTCGFCRRAVELLERRGAEVQVEWLDGDRARLARIQRAYGRRTVPVVLLDGELVGGLDALLELERRGALGGAPEEPA